MKKLRCLGCARHDVDSQSGNILFYILIGIVLIGLLTVALRDTGGLKGDVDNENAAVKATQILKYGGELAQGVQTVLGNGASENDLRFAYYSSTAAYGTITTTPQNQIFSSQGGNAPYRLPPAGVNDGSRWDFYADVAMVQVGSAKADLYATLGALTLPVCTALNAQIGITTLPVVSNCATGTAFSGTFSSSPLSWSVTPAPTLPMPQACIQCSSDSSYRFVTTLLAR